MHLAGQLCKARGTDDDRCTDLKLFHFGPDVWNIVKHVPSGSGSHRRDDRVCFGYGIADERPPEATLIDLPQWFADTTCATVHTYICSQGLLSSPSMYHCGRMRHRIIELWRGLKLQNYGRSGQAAIGWGWVQ
jgi:hypothetical protein